MFKKFDKDDINTATGRIEERISFEGALYSGYRQAENHFLSAGVSSSYYLTVTDDQPGSPWTEKLATVAYGMHTSSILYTYASASAIDHKNKVYRLYAKILLGDETAKFVVDNKPQNEMLFISVARNQLKDGIKPNTTNIAFLKGASSQNAPGNTVTFTTSFQWFSDIVSHQTLEFKGGQAANIFPVSGQFTGFTASAYSSSSVGLLFREHGTAALIPHEVFLTASGRNFSGTLQYQDALFSSSNALLDGFCRKFSAFTFVNYSRPQVTFFKCIAEKEEFNYSSNPSARNENGENISNSGSSNLSLKPTTYITQIALCGKNGEILAVAKPTQPIKKDPTKKVELNVRLVT